MRRGWKPLPEVCVQCPMSLQCRLLKRDCQRWKRHWKKVTITSASVYNKRSPEMTKYLKELDEALKAEYPPWDELTSEEELATLPGKSNGQNEVPEK